MSATLNAGSFRSDDTLYGASRTLKSYLRSILMHKHGIRLIPKVRWHRAGFRRYWRRKSRNLGGRPPIDAGLRALIRRMSIENTLWGAPRIQGELLKLGFAVAQSTVTKYMAGTDGRPCGQAGAPSCATICRRLQPLTCSWSRPSALACCTLWSLSGWLGEYAR